MWKTGGRGGKRVEAFEPKRTRKKVFGSSLSVSPHSTVRRSTWGAGRRGGGEH